MAENSRLSRKQTRAVAALLSTQTIAQAAEQCKVSERTLYRWLAECAFQQALKAAHLAVLDNVVRRLLAGSAQALDTLFELLQAESESVRLRAAVALLEQLAKLKTLEELEQRVSALEQKYGGAR